MDKPITIKILAGRIQKILSRGDVSADSQIGERVIFYTIRDALAFAMKGEWMRNKNQDGAGTAEHFIATFDLDVYDAGGDFDPKMSYADLPAIPLSLPDYTGIRTVHPLVKDHDKYQAMIPIRPDSMDIYRVLNAGLMEGQWCFEPDRGRIKFHKKKGKTLKESGIKKVRVRMVTMSPADTPVDVPLPLPRELVLEVMVKSLELLGYAQLAQKDNIVDDNVEQL